MYRVSTFLLLVGAATLVIALLVRRASPAGAARLARGLLFYAAAVGLAMLVLTAARLSQVLPASSAASFIHRVMIFRAWIPVGAGLAGVMLAGALRRDWFARVANPEAARAFSRSSDLVGALCISASLSYVAVEIGKLTFDAEMRRFFQDSGLPIWAHYAVVGAELAGAIGLLVRRLVVPAAAGLALLMIGAIATHAHNGDPFSDSLEALHLLIMLCCIITLAWGRARRPRGPG